MNKLNIFVDLDGTLLNEEGEVSSSDVEFIKNNSNKINLYIVTGMPFIMAKRIYDTLGLKTWLITSGGQNIWRDGITIHRDNILFEEVKALEDGDYLVIGSNGYYSKKCSLDKFVDGMKSYSSLEELNDITAIYSTIKLPLKNVMEYRWDIGDKEIYFYNSNDSSKYQAIQMVNDHDKIKDWYYFGNGRNDIESLKNATYPYIMKNSHPELFKYNFNVTKEDNNNSGVIKELKEIIKNQA